MESSNTFQSEFSLKNLAFFNGYAYVAVFDFTTLLPAPMPANSVELIDVKTRTVITQMGRIMCFSD